MPFFRNSPQERCVGPESTRVTISVTLKRTDRQDLPGGLRSWGAVGRGTGPGRGHARMRAYVCPPKREKPHGAAHTRGRIPQGTLCPSAAHTRGDASSLEEGPESTRITISVTLKRTDRQDLPGGLRSWGAVGRGTEPGRGRARAYTYPPKKRETARRRTHAARPSSKAAENNL